MKMSAGMRESFAFGEDAAGMVQARPVIVTQRTTDQGIEDTQDLHVAASCRENHSSEWVQKSAEEACLWTCRCSSLEPGVLVMYSAALGASGVLNLYHVECRRN